MVMRIPRTLQCEGGKRKDLGWNMEERIKDGIWNVNLDYIFFIVLSIRSLLFHCSMIDLCVSNM